MINGALMHTNVCVLKSMQALVSVRRGFLKFASLMLFWEEYLMAIYHFSGQIIGRTTKKGSFKSPLASAAYRSGEALHDEYEDKTFKYERKEKVESFIIKPNHAPEWALNRERLWNEVGKIEKNINSQFSREFNIALPVELRNDEQRELAIDFCQKAFVDEGMVADICIHRDDINNPHFHVMLTIRPFEENGTWGFKARREYLKDDKGNDILNKDGKREYKRVASVDWNTKEKLENWRELWADVANQHLKLCGSTEKISHLSNESLGTEKIPTIHEGYVAREMQKSGRESERISYNNDVKKYNKKVERIIDYKDRKNQINYVNKFTRKFSPQEKSKLSTIARELKFFVNFNNISERKEQLKRWKKSIQFKPDSDYKLNGLDRIGKEEEMIHQAENILEKEANRFIKEHYSTWDIEGLEFNEKIALVDETINGNKLLTEDQVDALYDQVRVEEVRNNLNDILKDRWIFIASIDEHIQSVKGRLVEQESTLGITLNMDKSDFETLTTKYPSEVKQFKNTADNLVKLNDVKEMFVEFYDLEFNKIYPELDSNKFNFNEKELLVIGSEYYGKPVDLSKENRRYETDQQVKIIECLSLPYPVRKERMNRDYPEFNFNNPVHLLLFKEECLNNEELATDNLTKLQNINPEKLSSYNVNKLVDLEELNAVVNEYIDDRRHSQLPQIAYGLNKVFRGILEGRDKDQLSKKQFEEDMQSGKKKKRRQNGMSL